MRPFRVCSLTLTDELTAPEQDDPRVPTEHEFATWQSAYEAVAPNPDDFFPFLERFQPVVHDWSAWTDDEVRSVDAPRHRRPRVVSGTKTRCSLPHTATPIRRRCRRPRW
jgi:hypothetical protein